MEKLFQIFSKNLQVLLKKNNLYGIFTKLSFATNSELQNTTRQSNVKNYIEKNNSVHLALPKFFLYPWSIPSCTP